MQSKLVRYIAPYPFLLLRRRQRHLNRSAVVPGNKDHASRTLGVTAFVDPSLTAEANCSLNVFLSLAHSSRRARAEMSFPERPRVQPRRSRADMAHVIDYCPCLRRDDNIIVFLRGSSRSASLRAFVVNTNPRFLCNPWLIAVFLLFPFVQNCG